MLKCLVESQEKPFSLLLSPCLRQASSASAQPQPQNLHPSSRQAEAGREEALVGTVLSLCSSYSKPVSINSQGAFVDTYAPRRLLAN